MPAPALIAKLTRPRLYAAAPRERLFALLDAHCARPAVWLDGPPGTGKTTLVTSTWRRAAWAASGTRWTPATATRHRSSITWARP